MIVYEDCIRDITDFLVDRTEAIIIYNNKVYCEDNHQYCIEQVIKDFWDKYKIDIYEDDCIAEASKITDKIFCNNEMTGYDVFDGGKENQYLLAHYPQNLEKDYDFIEEYAKERKLKLGTFISTDYLDNKFRLVKIND